MEVNTIVTMGVGSPSRMQWVPTPHRRLHGDRKQLQLVFLLVLMPRLKCCVLDHCNWHRNTTCPNTLPKNRIPTRRPNDAESRLQACTAGFNGPSDACSAKVFKESGYKGTLLATFNMNRTTEFFTFTLPSSTVDSISSIKLSGTCGGIMVWDGDECVTDGSANILYIGSVYELLSNLDNNVCKVTI